MAVVVVYRVFLIVVMFQKEDVVFRHVMAPKGPSAHFKQRKLDDRMEQLEKLVVELQYKVGNCYM